MTRFLPFLHRSDIQKWGFVGWVPLLASIVIAGAGCLSPGEAGVETYASTTPTEPLTEAYVTVVASPASHRFRDALREELSAALDARRIEADVETSTWTAPSDTSAGESRRTESLARAQKENVPLLLQVVQAKHGLEDTAPGAKAWGYLESESEHITLLRAAMVDVKTKDVHWQAEVVTRSHRLESDATRAQLAVEQLTRALVRDGWLAPLLAPTATR
jgi:DNA-binding phage protein